MKICSLTPYTYRRIPNRSDNEIVPWIPSWSMDGDCLNKLKRTRTQHHSWLERQTTFDYNDIIILMDDETSVFGR